MTGLADELNRARARLDDDVRLMRWALDLRERLWWGLDLEDMAAEVGAFKRAVQTRKRSGPRRAEDLAA